MISVIMASYLGDYPGAASNREAKLERAIASFLKQNIGELIIIADGCEKTVDIVKTYPNSNIKLIEIDKQPLFSGKVRQVGIEHASYNWICYLDSDDEFAEGHLQTLLNGIDSTHEWYYWDDTLVNTKRSCAVAMCRIGTSCIMHRKDTKAIWPTGYNHDWGFIQQLGSNYKKIEGAGYIVNHVPNRIDV